MIPCTEIAVRSVSRHERDAALATITAAFATDPVVRWAWPEERGYAARFPVFAAALGGRAFAYGTADRTDAMDGVALWIPPAVAPDEAAVIAATSEGVPDALRAELHSMLEQMGSSHPSGPHWYLPLIGVTPARQGQGRGAALLRHALARCDQDHLPAYLESTNPANLPLYLRHGFEVVGTIRVSSAPPLHPMVRAAR